MAFRPTGCGLISAGVERRRPEADADCGERTVTSAASSATEVAERRSFIIRGAGKSERQGN